MTANETLSETVDIVPDGNHYQVYQRDGLPPSTTVVAAVAAVSETDPIELNELAAVIDPDALDHLFDNKKEAGGFARFEYNEYEVTVHSNDHVTLRG